MSVESISFMWNGVLLAGDLYLPAVARRPVPATVSAPGLGGVKEMLLPTFAEAFARAGVASLIFDYAGFGASGGEPRQHIDPVAQVEQFGRALDWLAADDRIDARRLGGWGTSMAGGHTLRLAATEPQLRCALAIVPFTSVDDVEPNPQLIEAVLADADARGRGVLGKCIPSFGRPGELAVLSSDGAWEWSERITANAPSFRNQLTLASLVEVAGYRPADLAAEINVPLRLILAVHDTIAPAAATRDAMAGVKELSIVEFPETHFELFDSSLSSVVECTVEWFAQHL